MNSIETLHKQVRELPYPESIKMISDEIKGAAFFPGGTGLVEGDKPLNQRSIMVLGQDQDNESGFAKSLGEGDEVYSSTWRNMKALFDSNGISLQDSFFTNFIMGIRRGNVSNTGKSPAFLFPEFLQECSNLFIEQLKAQRPRLILTLGFYPYKLLGLVSPEIRLRSLGLDTFREIDLSQSQMISNATFQGVQDLKCTVVALYHPSFRPQNIRHRIYKQLKGIAAEDQLIRDAIKKSL